MLGLLLLLVGIVLGLLLIAKVLSGVALVVIAGLCIVTGLVIWRGGWPPR